VTTTQIETQTQGGLRGFLNKGGFWRFLPVMAVYFAIYVPAGGVVARLADPSYSEDDLLSSAGTIFIQLTGGLIVGSIVLIAFTTFMGWNAEIFGRQPIYRSGWMWLAPAIVLTPIILRVLGIDWGGRGLQVSMMMMATGLLIGFSEELLYRGVAVKMLRSGGHREFSVAAISSLLFGLSHTINLISGAKLTTVLATVPYTIAFGVLMYLSMRVIGFIAGAMILHGLTDPTTFLATGGLPDDVDTTAVTGLLAIAGQYGTLLVVLAGFIMVFFIRGRVGEPKATRAQAAA
jgi:CAAX protease family protein